MDRNVFSFGHYKGLVPKACKTAKSGGKLYLLIHAEKHVLNLHIDAFSQQQVIRGVQTFESLSI